jgi:hypothetical protein
MVPAPRSPINIVDEQSGHLSGTRQRFRARTFARFPFPAGTAMGPAGPVAAFLHRRAGHRRAEKPYLDNRQCLL